MYKSPIEVFTDELNLYYDNNIVEAVQRYDINIDKDELLKALRYDRQQYEKGFADGKIAAIDEIVRCKDCICARPLPSGDIRCILHTIAFTQNGFCSYGTRRTNNE